MVTAPASSAPPVHPHPTAPIRHLLGLTVLGAAVACASPTTQLASVPPADPTPTPKTSVLPTTPRATPTAASRSRHLIPTTRQPVAPVSSHPFESGTAGSWLHWRALRECESGNNYSDRDSSTYRGAYQFDRRTWQSVGGHGDPAAASPAEQDMRAQLLYDRRGRQPWPVCGRYL